jgi:hypothetical protein
MVQYVYINIFDPKISLRGYDELAQVNNKKKEVNK